MKQMSKRAVPGIIDHAINISANPSQKDSLLVIFVRAQSEQHEIPSVWKLPYFVPVHSRRVGVWCLRIRVSDRSALAPSPVEAPPTLDWRHGRLFPIRQRTRQGQAKRHGRKGKTGTGSDCDMIHRIVHPKVQIVVTQNNTCDGGCCLDSMPPKDSK